MVTEATKLHLLMVDVEIKAEKNAKEALVMDLQEVDEIRQYIYTLFLCNDATFGFPQH